MDTTQEPKQQLPAAAFSVGEFCATHRISRALFYLLQRRKTGPRVMRVGRRTLITAEAAAKWRQQMESEAAGRVK